MRIASVITLTLGLLFNSSLSFSQSKTVLFTYDGDTVDTEEFMRVFLKNNKKEEQNDSSLKAYLDLYINFKLKVREAHSLGMQNNPSFQQELAGYREQLSRTYMTDTSLTAKLMDEAYERMKSEVNASHILILVGPNSLPKDTLRAYNRMMDIRKKALAGVNFDSLAFQYSEDISAKTNFGDLGYFSAFDMIYPFETQAFNTPVGQVSQIFRTEFGYHIIKVKNKRTYRGEVKVAHIMLRLQNPSDSVELASVKRKADSIYAQLKGGADWIATVQSYSEDQSSLSANGELNWLRTNSTISTPFREAAFGLVNPGDITEPVMTEFGYHIIKLIDKRGLASKEDLLDRLRMQVNREPERVKMSQESLVKKFKEENGFVEFPQNLKPLVTKADSSVIRATFKLDSSKVKPVTLFKIGNRELGSLAFFHYVEQYQTNQPDLSIEAAMMAHYKAFVTKEVLQYQKDHLEEKYPDFRHLMGEYHDGILLFNLTQEKVWDRAVQDTVGLLAFYERNKQAYQWKERVQAHVYECNNKESYSLTRKLLKKGTPDIDISKQVNEKNPLSLVIKKSRFQRGEHPQVDQVKWKVGTHTLKAADGKYYIVKVNEVLPAGPKGFNEVKGLMTGKYQDELEKAWIAELRGKYKVNVNQDVLDGLLK